MREWPWLAPPAGPGAPAPHRGPETSFDEALSQQFDGVRIASTGFTGPSMLEAAQATVDSGRGDLFAIGRDFLATPDLVELRTGAPLNEQRQELFCSGGAEGYTVYPRVG